MAEPPGKHDDLPIELPPPRQPRSARSANLATPAVTSSTEGSSAQQESTAAQNAASERVTSRPREKDNSPWLLAVVAAVVCVIIISFSAAISTNPTSNPAGATAATGAPATDAKTSIVESSLPTATEANSETPLPSRPVSPSSTETALQPAETPQERKKRAEAAYKAGKKHWEQRRFAEAAASYEKAAVIQPDFAEAWCSRAWALARMNENSSAIECFRKAVDLKPSLANAWHGLVKSYVATADSREAFEAIKRLQKLDSETAANVLRDVDPDFVKQIAVLEFPDLGVPSSALNLEFRNRSTRYRETNPNYFKRGDWPLRLSRECARTLKQSRASN